MFDVDGTLVRSFEFDELCFTQSVYEALGLNVDTDWESYTHITDTGLLMEVLEREGSSISITQALAEVKPKFINKVSAYAAQYGVEAISGAVEFIEHLKRRSDVCLSFATGGWLETALIKLRSAGFDTQGVSIASSNDHFKRTEIMRIALGSGAGLVDPAPIYFGDAVWDKNACAELGFDFVLVGDRTQHNVQISDFTEFESLKSLGLI